MRRILLFLLACSSAPPLRAQSDYLPTPENLEARRSFQEARFGLFVHWGVYSLLGAGEWVMYNRHIQVEDYQRLPSFFNPIGYDPKAWVALAKAAGMKYITVTTRHHDGFAMFDSKASDYNIVQRTPYGRDVIRLLVDEARQEGIKVFFYYSQLDWRRPDYFPRGQTGEGLGRPEQGDFNRYLDFMNAQLTELLTNYGPIGGIWFDGMWDRPDADWRLDDTYRLIHRLQPAALIGSNHHHAPYPGEDFQMFEKDLPGRNTAGWNTSEIGALPLETCETIATSWGFNITDRGYKSSRDLIRYLVNAAGNDANFLLNVGPQPDGRIQPEFVERLKGMGVWLERHGEAIYGTRGGPLSPRPWGVTTQKGNRVYVHLLEWPAADDLWLPLERKVTGVRLLDSGAPIRFRQNGRGVLLEGLPASSKDDVDTIVVLELGAP